MSATGAVPPTLSWAVVGLGNIAERVARAVAATAGTRLHSVCSRDIAKARVFAARHGGPTALDDYDAVLADGAVDVIYIATPNSLHAAQTLAALDAGKHVLVEKPMALSLEDAARVVDAASKRRRMLGVGFQLRHHPVHQAIRRMIEGGEIGTPIYARALWGSYYPDFPRDRWQMDPALAGAGSLMGLGVHLIDLLSWLIGRRVRNVSAFSDGPSAVRPVEFLTAALLDFGDDVIGEIVSSRRLPNAENSATVYGERQRLEARGTLGMDPAGLLVAASGANVAETRLPLSDLYEREVIAFCKAVRGEAAYSGTGEEALHCVAVTDALLRSIRTRRAEPVVSP